MPASAAPSDEELMLDYAAGDATAFDQLYSRHKGGVYRYMLRQCSHGGVVEELFQDVWTNLIRARRGYTPSAKFTTWLYRLAHNRLIDHYRSNGVATTLSADDDMHAEAVATIAAPTREGSGKVPVRFPPKASHRARKRHKLIIERGEIPTGAWCRCVDVSPMCTDRGGEAIHHGEIAELTDVGVETVKSRLRYAMNKLRSNLSDLYEAQR